MRLNIGTTVRVGLAPAMVEVTAFDWRGRAVGSSRAAPEGAVGGWKGAAAGLRAQLAGGKWKAGSAEIVLSSHFVRYCLLPAELRAGKPAEQSTYVRHVFRAEYGEAVNGWRIATDEAANGPRLACAIEAALFEELAQICRASGVRLRSVLPYLTVCANAGRALIRAPAGWLVVLEGNLCIAALLEAGGWQHIARRRLAQVSGAAILDMLREQQVLLGGASPARHLYVSGAAREILRDTDTGGWTVEFLPAATPAPVA
ncbi:MAG TPA: hypothetical protein VGN52_13995 [Burkholderiales bacterium]|jgi:hypothetical protein